MAQAESGTEAYLATDGAGLILEANRLAAQELNLAAEFLIGKPLAVFVRPGQLHGFFTHLAEVRASPGVHRWEMSLWPYRQPSFEARLRVTCDPAGLPAPRVHWRWEVPASRRGVQARPAQQAPTAVQQPEPGGADDAAEILARTYVAAISHELLTPLAIVAGNVELLQDPAVRADPALATTALGVISDELDRLRRQVGNVLDSTRLSVGSFSVEQVPLQLQPLVQRVVERFGGRSRRHRFAAELPSPLPLVLGDRERLESVLYNMLDNAVKYAPGGGLVVVRAAAHPTEVEISVHDEGLGIPLAERSHVFQPFYRLGSGPHARIKGSGLGLHLSRAIVEAHGGRIWIDGTSERGTIVRFTVPRATPARRESTADPQGAAG